MLDLQGHDARLDRLDYRRRMLPEIARVDQLEGRRAELSTRLGLEQTELSDLSAEVRKADADVAQVRTRRERDQRRLDTGAVGSPKELEQLQHEIVSLDRRIAALEDAELEVMERLEVAHAAVTETEAQSSALGSELESERKLRDEALAELGREADVVRSERATTAAAVPDELRALYEKLRGQHGGVGAAALHQKRCEGCRLELTAADLHEIRVEPPETVLRCPECNRLLVRTPESGL